MHLLFNGPFYSARLYSSREILQQMGKEQQPYYCWLPVSPPPAAVLELRSICLSEPTAPSEEKQSHLCLGEELQAGWGKYLKRTFQQVSPDYSLKGINAPGRRDWGVRIRHQGSTHSLEQNPELFAVCCFRFLGYSTRRYNKQILHRKQRNTETKQCPVLPFCDNPTTSVLAMFFTGSDFLSKGKETFSIEQDRIIVTRVSSSLKNQQLEGQGNSLGNSVLALHTTQGPLSASHILPQYQ